MDSIRINGGVPLKGTIGISGAKNAALKVMAASLLTDQTLTLANLPHLSDIATLTHLLQGHGVAVAMNGASGNGGHVGRVLELTAREIISTVAPYEVVRKMRASILVLGPLLARCGQAEVSLPGGCAIGTRPVDLHLMGLEALGAEIELRDGYVHARAPRGLKGATIRFPKVSVGATENLMMAATLAKGQTILENAAREPEVADLAHCLVAMGARIDGIGQDRVIIDGVPSLHGAEHRVLPDRIETGTYAVAAAITGGELDLMDADSRILGAVIEVMERAGVGFTDDMVDGRRRLRVTAGRRIRPVDIVTQPYPGFPTDMQAQTMALLCLADGASTIVENIFENRFMHVPELCRMGANIAIRGSTAVVRGVSGLKGAPVMATDLRASVSLVLAGLAAEGETIVNRVYHLDRGYERVEDKLAACGARIERVKG